MSVADLKNKIEQNPTAFIITDEDLSLILEAPLTGSFKILQEIEDFGEREFDRDYQLAFNQRFVAIVKGKSFQNLSYNELRHAVSVFDEKSDEFKEVVKNLTNDTLGPALAEFSFEQFDSQVTEIVNSGLKSGRTFSFTNLPTLSVSGNPSVLVPDFPNDTKLLPRPFIDASKWNEIADAYTSQNGSDPRTSSGLVSGNSQLELSGNVSRSTTEFQLEEVAAGGGGLLDAIIDFFTDYNSPSTVVNAQYKSFLVDALKNTQTIQASFNREKDQAASVILENVLYDFEYERREGLYNTISADPDAAVEDILNGAEAAALASLSGSGLLSEGGISSPQDAINVEERQRFFEQCILLASMEKFKDTFLDSVREEGNIDNSDPQSALEKMHQPSPYQERFYMVQVPTGQNDRIVNFLNAPRGNLVNDFLNLTPDIQAFLTPKIRLYKVFNEGDRLKQVEFIFRNSEDNTSQLKEMFLDNSRFFRGAGYGIKNFSFSFNGTTPATAKNDITADLTLYFQDFTDFVQPMVTSQGNFRFVDLIFYDKKNSENPLYGHGATHPDQYSPAYYRIRADVGWRVPENNPQFNDACRKRNIDPDNVRDVIEKTNKSYYLNMVEHELDFKRDGTVEIKAQYRGYIESVLKGTEMDALASKEIISKRENRQLQLESALRSCTPGEIASIKRIYAAQERLDREELYQNTYKRLIDLGKVRTFRVPPGGDGGFRKEGYFVTKPTIEDLGVDNITTPDDIHAYYFLGDLLYVMMDAMYDSGNQASPIDKTKFILPTIEFENFFEDSGAFSINIAQIPISHRYFTEWWADNVIKAKKQSYPIMFYLRDILNNLIADALIDICLNRNYRKSFNFQTTSVMASGNPLENISNLTDPIITLEQDDLPFTVEEGSDINDMTNYVLVYAAYSTTLPKGTGQYVDDLENGVYHFHLGQDRGIIHEVKFSKVDMAYIREARYKRDGIDGLLQLGAVYRANLTMFGNTLFYPGMLLYINPFGIGGEEFIPSRPNSIANKLGLGGYHLIEKVNSSIASGMFKTTVDAMFVYSGDGDTRFNLQGNQEEAPEGDIENPEKIDPTCSNLVAAVRTDYLNTLQGQDTELSRAASVEANTQNFTNTLKNAGVDIPPPEAPPEPSTTGIPDTGVNIGLSPEDLLDQQQEPENIPFVGPSIPQPTGGSE
jgi:hypothetical protein